jgi:hypothetical protein
MYAKAKKNYQEFKTSMADRSRDSFIAAKHLLEQRKESFEKTLDQWRQLIRLGSRFSPAMVTIRNEDFFFPSIDCEI